ncbi:succinylglutamate desuccinylase/aspartoacylase family protein [Halobacteriovorax sp. JY17]|uniref:succinylglutamate desuccinylase/aspartoacylase family protein n=1 Tax=Halobacteriovorax sp. JY17 TaxID=2014617 RepID=UPI000C555E6A|nr:succinylglutamate desuccinylase/aspartoacylase family protein [Halobacteriovorax sp. JY17]PIK16323.1 MAG: succinylglutamate desuccinylase [Halobacteriovorax sp. JY17]
MSKEINKDPEILKIGKTSIKRGKRVNLSLEVASLYDHTPLSIPIEVIRGKVGGPTLFISAAVHGDELNGVEIIRRILKRKELTHIKGTLILVPVVNIFGFNNKSRYLPDRRDLNRSFPGTSGGSLASRMAKLFMKEVIDKCTHGIDLHTGAIHRTNLPQIRACLEDEKTRELAESFGVPVIIDSKLRDGSLREAARTKKVTTLLFEGGEALRFNESVIRSGIKGCFSVMEKIGMIKKPASKKPKLQKNVFIANSSYWIRSPHSGTVHFNKMIGDRVKNGDLLASVSNTFGRESIDIHAKEDGILVGLSVLPLVNQGDALFHLATFKNSTKVKKALELYGEDE